MNTHQANFIKGKAFSRALNDLIDVGSELLHNDKTNFFLTLDMEHSTGVDFRAHFLPR